MFAKHLEIIPQTTVSFPPIPKGTNLMSNPSETLSSTYSMELLTPQQLSDRLQVKPSWVYEQTRSRSGVRDSDPLPHIKMGLYLRFDWRDVCAWLVRRKQRHRDN
jgi:hypothetical protein